jgi:hypothetical protein
MDGIGRRSRRAAFVKFNWVSYSYFFSGYFPKSKKLERNEKLLNLI